MKQTFYDPCLNPHLVPAAPEMLKALEVALEALRKTDQRKNKKATIAVYDAISLARGEK